MSAFGRRVRVHAMPVAVEPLRPISKRRQLLAMLGLLPLAPAPAAEITLPRIDDLRQEAAEVRRAGRPLLLFFSTPGCPYCAEVRRGYLAPRVAEGSREVLIREVVITSDRKLLGLSGEALSESGLADRFGVRVVPVVQLVDAGLQPLGKPLVGINAAGFYESYLSAAITEAVRALRGR